MSEPLWSREMVAQIEVRALPGGGFANREGENFRPDATAWAVLALRAHGVGGELQDAARQRLAAAQLADGRVSISPEHPKAFWPTPLAILAWQGSPMHRAAQDRAVAFLLATSGEHWEKQPDAIHGHDSIIKGWPWTADTHSWTEPPSLAVIALRAAGYGDHERVAEARRMLLDRQIPGGGWNYGNTTMFDQTLPAMPESTGLVLDCLSDKTSRVAIQRSVAYLEKIVATLNTPRTLGWALLGLTAWGARPAAAGAWIEACLAREDRFGGYDTVSLALLLVAQRASGGLATIYKT